MTAFKEIQIVHAGPLAETQVYVVEGWVTAEDILSGDPRGVVCLCLMPEVAPRLLELLNMGSHEPTAPAQLMAFAARIWGATEEPGSEIGDLARQLERFGENVEAEGCEELAAPSRLTFIGGEVRRQAGEILTNLASLTRQLERLAEDIEDMAAD